MLQPDESSSPPRQAGVPEHRESASGEGSPDLRMVRLSLRPSEQVAFMQSEVEELEKLLRMASTMASLLEHYQEINRQASLDLPEAVAGDPAAARALSLIRSAASGVQPAQRELFGQLMRSTQTVARELTQAAALALRGMSEAAKAPLAAWEQDHAEAAMRVVQLRPTPEEGEPLRPTLDATGRPEPDSDGSGTLGAASVSGRSSGPASDETTPPGLTTNETAPPRVAPVEVGHPRPATTEIVQPPAPAPSVPAARPLGAWVRALSRFYSSAPSAGGMPLLPLAAPPSPRASDSDRLMETRVAVCGVSSLSEVLAAHQALAGVGGVREVSINHVEPDGAELLVRHEARLDLATTAAGMIIDVRVMHASPGFLAIEVGGKR